MFDNEAISNLQDRLAELEIRLDSVRTGRTPAPAVDLLTWSAAPRGPEPPANEGSRLQRLVQAIRQSLREDWTGLIEAIDRWTARVDERFARH